MTIADTYRTLFAKWPTDVARRGIVLSRQGEVNPFKGFMLAESMVLLERANPDTLGARFVAMPYEEVAGVKFVDPLKATAFEAMGFAGKLSQ